MNEETRNFVLFVVVTLVLVMVYETFVVGPMEKRREAQLAQTQAQAAQTTGVAPSQPAAPKLTLPQALSLIHISETTRP